MAAIAITPLASPLRLDDTGVVRVGATRVTLDTLVGSYRDGNTAEEIVQQFPTLALADVHAAIAFYLTHVSEVEAYLLQRQKDATNIRPCLDINERRPRRVGGANMVFAIVIIRNGHAAFAPTPFRFHNSQKHTEVGMSNFSVAQFFHEVRILYGSANELDAHRHEQLLCFRRAA
jgi:uncharacterized protein (DUF433 family)